MINNIIFIYKVIHSSHNLTEVDTVVNIQQKHGETEAFIDY